MDGTGRRARLARSRLYLVLDARPHGQDPADLLDAALRGGVDVVQLRDKELPDDELVAAAEPFRRACDAHGALFVLNDRPELVERCGADGVHVGQSDAPAADARHIVGAERIVGLSVSTLGGACRGRGPGRLSRSRRRLRHTDEVGSRAGRPRARPGCTRHGVPAVVRDRRRRARHRRRDRHCGCTRRRRRAGDSRRR